MNLEVLKKRGTITLSLKDKKATMSYSISDSTVNLTVKVDNKAYSRTLSIDNLQELRFGAVMPWIVVSLLDFLKENISQEHWDAKITKVKISELQKLRKFVINQGKEYIQKSLEKLKNTDAPIKTELEYWLNDWDKLLQPYLNSKSELSSEAQRLIWLSSDVEEYLKEKEPNLEFLIESVAGIMDTLNHFISEIELE